MLKHLCYLSALYIERILSWLTHTGGALLTLLTFLVNLARQAGHILAQQLFKLVGTNVARHNKVHARQVCKALVVDVVHTVKVYLLQAVNGDGLCAQALAIYRGAQRVVISNVGAGVTVLQH